MSALAVEQPAKSPTIVDVARRAGVSTATVSRVLNVANGQSPVSDPTRIRVWEAVEALGYRPNLTARGLSRRRTQTIGLVVPQTAGALHTAYTALLVSGVSDTLAASGHSLALYFSDYGHDRSGQNHARRLQDGRVDGGLVLDSFALEYWQVAELEAEASRLPFVMVGHRLPNSRLDFVSADDYGGGAAAVAHLAELGHRRIACVRNLRGAPAAERWRGFQDAVASHQLVTDERWVVDDVAALPGRCVEIFSGRDAPTGLVTWSDLVAMSALRALHQAGRAVPRNVSVVGYDDFEVAQLTLPALTTVHQPLYQMGALAAEVLLRRIAGGGGQNRPVQRTLPTVLVPRESTAPPP